MVYMLVALHLALAAVLAAGAGDPAGLSVITGVTGAEVALDDRPIGATPLAVPIAPGRHRITVTHPGFVIASTTIEVAPGEVVRLVVPLHPIPPRRRTGLVVGTALATDTLAAPPRIALWCGLREPGDRWELSLRFEAERAAMQGGLDARVFALTEMVRPFARAAVLGPSPTLAGGVGVAVGRVDPRTGRDFLGLVELDLRRTGGATSRAITIGVMARL